MKPKVDPQALDEHLKASLQKRWPAQPRDAAQTASIIAYIDKKSRRHPVKTSILSTVRMVGLATLLVGLIAIISLSMRMLAPVPANNTTETTTSTWQPNVDCQTVRYEVQPGDTLSSVAVNYNVPIEEIAKWNGFGKNAALTPGSELTIPLCERGTPGPTPSQPIPTITPTVENTSTETPSPTPEADITPVVIKFVAWEYERPMYEPFMAQFHEQYPHITVEFVVMTESDDEVRQKASSGDTSIIYGNRSMEQVYGSYYRDLSPMMGADPQFEPEDFWSGALNTCKGNDGRQLGIPLMINPNGIFYHKGAFDAAEVPYPKPGWTWDDMQQAISALAKTGGDILLPA